MCCFTATQCWPCWACYCGGSKTDKHRKLPHSTNDSSNDNLNDNPNARIAYGHKLPKSLNTHSSSDGTISTTSSRRKSQSSMSTGHRRSTSEKRHTHGYRGTSDGELPLQMRCQSWPAGKATTTGSMDSNYQRATAARGKNPTVGVTRSLSASHRGRRVVVGGPGPLFAAAQARGGAILPINLSPRRDKESEYRTHVRRSSGDTREPDPPKPETPPPAPIPQLQTLPVEFSLDNLGAFATESLQDASSSAAPKPTILKPIPGPSFIYPEDGPLPTTRKEHHDSLTKHLRETGLHSLISLRDPRPHEIASVAAASAPQICEDLHLSRYATPDLTKLGLYDVIVYCDDSGSMQMENRYGALKTVVQRIARIASAYNSTGIKIRFMNATNDDNFNGITTEEKVDACLDAVQPNGWTPLGTKLFEKVIQPLVVQKAMKGELRGPVVVSVVTDGQPLGEDAETLKRTILATKNVMSKLLTPRGQPYNPSTVIFHIARVGTSMEAKGFLQSLQDDPEVKDLVVVADESLDWAVSEARDDVGKLNTWLTQLLAGGIRR